MSRTAIVMQAKTIGILIGAQFTVHEGDRKRVSYDSRTAITALQSKAKKQKFTLKCHKTLNNLVRERVMELF